MGGRGREQQQKDRWDWVSELSDSRLERYGKMSSHKDAADMQKGALNWACAKEYERRKGAAPEWKK